ncbi:uncharacterized protein cubi_00281 [Cryptosporidium ubiquitum]|uniref:Uncharacterized protein n=1 Tax=Cryptosporidium ubiquitum TaxID=857276 RepID=A0A1J4MKI9_9CRYT|nr:uncharacterized protein cubi_00281 [Cryptosporidium ubiquitum]OII74728.1 hypothetical protein cubi_00281 [Cryptosporidium ubiquitum]
MNDLMSFGLHGFFKDIFVEHCFTKISLRIKRGKSKEFSHANILDVAGITGDISFIIVNKFGKEY